MKNVLTIVSIALLSTVVQAENNIEVAEAVEAGQGAVTNAAQAESGAVSKMVHAENATDDLNLWKILDVDKNGSISKEEAVSSKEVFENWDILDANKDEKLDTEEFAQMFSQEK